MRMEENTSTPTTRVVNGTVRYADTIRTGDVRPLKPKYGLTLNGTDERATSTVAGIPETGDFTVTMWFTSETTTDRQWLFSQYASGETGRLLVELNSNNSVWTANYVRVFLDGYGTWDRPATIPTTGWHHLTFTRSGDTFRLQIEFADGTSFDDSFESVGQTVYQGEFWLGAGPGVTVYPLQGKMDDVRVYDVALSSSDVKAIAAVKPGGKPPTISATPLLHYTFEDPVSSSIIKNVGSLPNADLTLTGVLTNMRAQVGYLSFANSDGYGSSYTTDGTTSQYINTGVTLDGGTAFTVWRRARYLSTLGYDLDGFWNDGGEAVRLGRDNANDQIYANLGDQNADTPGISIFNNETHTLCIQSSVGGTERLWLNGVVLKSAAASMSQFTSQTITYKIGNQESTSGGVSHSGHVEYYEYLIAKRVLTDDELTWLETGGAYGTPVDVLNDPDILLYYDFEDEHPDFIYNKANPALPGIINGGEWSTVPRSSVDTSKDVQQVGSSYRSAIKVDASADVDLGSVLIGATADFDISADFYAAGFPAVQEGIIGQYAVSQAGRFWVSLSSAGKVSFFINGTTNVLIDTGDGAVELGKWYKVRATRVGDVFTLYLDGKLIGTQTQSGISVRTSAATQVLSSETGTTFPAGSMISNLTINGTSYLTTPDETISGATLTNASYVNVARGRPGTLTFTGAAPHDRVLTEPALLLNGTSEYVTLPDMMNLTGDEAVEFEALVNVSLNSTYIIMSRRDTGADGWAWWLDAGRPSLLFRDTGGNEFRVRADQTIGGTGWTHLKTTYDGSRDVEGVKHYIDGVEITSRTETDSLGATSVANPGTVYIGTQIAGSLSGKLAGSLSNVKATVAGTQVGHWSFAANSGSFEPDLSGNGNDGELVGVVANMRSGVIDGKGSGLLMQDGYSVATWMDGVNDYLDKQSRLTNGALTQLSYQFHFWRDQSVATEVLLCEDDRTANSIWGCYANADDTLSVYFSNDGSTLGIATTDDPVLPASEYHSVSAVYDAGSLTIKVDGSVAAYTVTGSIPTSLVDTTGDFAIGAYSDGVSPAGGTISQVKVEATAWNSSDEAALLATGKTSEVAAIRPNCWFFPDAKTETLQGIPALTVNGAPEQRVIPAGTGLPPISYGPGVLAPDTGMDLYCGEDDAPYSVGISDHLADGDYEFGDGSEGNILFVSGDENQETLVLLDDATDHPELFE